MSIATLGGKDKRYVGILARVVLLLRIRELE